ncbi:MAG: glycosyltransferase family 2 protein [Nitrospiraceae bacterium]|nr:glycosyltransferase family 2 protein [Nitrospiraceae bacterium]
MGPKGKKIIVVMPAYNAAATLGKTYMDIPKEWVDEIVLVDDFSRDKTVEEAKALNLKVIAHSYNIGYGGNQKTCYLEALKDGADIVVMLHPDYQYDPRIIPELVKPLLGGETDAVFASRMLHKPLAGGMPLYKYIANKTLTFVENRAMGLNLSEYHTGYRAYGRQVLERIPFLDNSNDFVFDNEIIAQLVHFGFRIKEIPVKTHYGVDSSSVGFLSSIKYGLGVLRTINKYKLHKSGARKYRFLEEKR